MKVAILADPLDNQRAGVHVFTKELINGLIELGKGDQLLLIREKVDPTLPVEQIAVPNIRLPIGFASLRLFFIVPFILRRKDVTAVFEPAHFGPFNLPKRIKRITMIHDLTPILFPQYHRWHSQILQRIFLKRILKKTDWILANSKHTQNDIHKVFPFSKNKTSHIYLGKNDLFIPKNEPDRIKQLGIDTPYFINVGTIEPRKNLILLLKAFETFCLKTNDQTKLVIVGQLGWKSEAFQKALNEHPFKNQIILTGFISTEDLAILYSHSIALIYPSEYEGFGLPVIEAMACGSQAIVANNSSLKEIGEGAAVFFQTKNVSSLLDTMNFVYLNKKEADTDIVLKHAEKFSWKHCAEGFWENIIRL